MAAQAVEERVEEACISAEELDPGRAPVVHARRLPSLRLPWALLLVLVVQAGASLPLIWSNTAFGDEALYLWLGHHEIAHWFQGGVGGWAYQSKISGAPQIYPPIAALLDSTPLHLAAVRLFALVLMLAATALLYRAALILYGQPAAIAASIVWATTEGALRMGAFATFDPMAIFCICAAMWAVVETTVRARRLAFATTAGLLLALGGLTAYSYAIYIPAVIAGAAVLWNSRLDRRLATSSTLWLAGVTAVVFSCTATLLDVWEGMFVTTVSRALPDQRSTTDIVQSVWSLDGLAIVLCAIGAVIGISRARTRGERLWLSIMLATALIVPLYQVVAVHTDWSLDKHLACGVWIAALCAAAGAKGLSIRGTRRAAVFGVAALATVGLGWNGWFEAFQVQKGWANTASLVTAVRRFAPQLHGEAVASLPPQILAYYTVPGSLRPSSLQWFAPVNFSRSGTPAELRRYYESTLARVAPRLVVLTYPGSVPTLSASAGGVARRLRQLSIEDNKNIAAFTAVLLSESPRYTVVATGPYDFGVQLAGGFRRGSWVMWRLEGAR